MAVEAWWFTAALTVQGHPAAATRSGTGTRTRKLTVHLENKRREANCPGGLSHTRSALAPARWGVRWTDWRTAKDEIRDTRTVHWVDGLSRCALRDSGVSGVAPGSPRFVVDHTGRWGSDWTANQAFSNGGMGLNIENPTPRTHPGGVVSVGEH